MPIVIGVFASGDELQQALARLAEEGFRDEIVRSEPEEERSSAPRESDLGLAPGANQAGALADLKPSSDLERFDLSEDEHEFLQLALDRGAEMVAIDTDRVDDVISVLEDLHAQQIRDPR